MGEERALLSSGLELCDSKKREAGSPLVFAISVALCLNNDAINVC
jgi:hypothetical protein